MKRIAVGLVAALMAALWLVPAGAIPDNVVARKVKGTFADVRQEVMDAVIARGLVVDHNARIGEMLDRTAEAVGSKKKIYEAAELVQFCSALLSRKMMEADPANIAFCPFIIFMYERADEPGVVYVGFRELEDESGSAASNMAIEQINELLSGIVDEAAGQ